MRFTPLLLKGSYRIDLEPKGDERGFFARLFCKKAFAEHDLVCDWAQSNTSFSAECGALRGLHFQRPPMAEVKMVRCLKGAVWDVIVDLRAHSETFGQWHSERLDESNRTMLYVPEGFAHGFQTLTDNVEMLYFHSKPYSASDEGGLFWNDPSLSIPWPLPVKAMSQRDASLPLLKNVEPIKL